MVKVNFKSKNAQEIRTWILFFVGVVIVILFAINETPLDPWWTLIIGAFTCTTIIVSAVQSFMTGLAEQAKKEISKEISRESTSENNGSASLSNSTDLGTSCPTFILCF